MQTHFIDHASRLFWRLVPAAIIILGIVAMLSASGCTNGDHGLRFPPSEQQKQTALGASELAGVAATQGLPPGSPAARQLASMTNSQVVYTGSPKEPLNLSALLPEGVVSQWQIQGQQLQALKLKSQLKDKALEVQSTYVADLAKDLTAKSKVAGKELLARLQGVADIAKASAEVADSIQVPGDPVISDAERQRMQKLDLVLAQINQQAKADASNRAGFNDVVDDGFRKANDQIDFWTQVFPWLIGVPGVGGVAAAVKNGVAAGRARKQKAESDAQVQQAQLAQADLARGFQQIVNQVDVIRDLASAQGQPLSGADLITAVLKGQDPVTQKLVTAAKAGKKKATPAATEPSAPPGAST